MPGGAVADDVIAFVEPGGVNTAIWDTTASLPVENEPPANGR